MERCASWEILVPVLSRCRFESSSRAQRIGRFSALVLFPKLPAGEQSKTTRLLRCTAPGSALGSVLTRCPIFRPGQYRA